ncbi:MAG: hypothetical protein J5517_02980 [Eubacterium sp.]|nr:hypothetical protein [Eubacterium sp.]
MPRKNKDKYPRYEEIKQFYDLHRIETDFGELGEFLSDDWKEYFDEIVPVISTETEKISTDKLNGLGFTNQVFEEDKSDLLKRGKKIIAGMEKKVKDFQGPFKEMLEAMYYVSNPNNGDMLDMLMDQPELERVIISPFGDMPTLTNTVTVDGKKVKVIDVELNKKREEALGEFAGLYNNYFKSAKELTQVIYERQKAESKGETGLDTAYAAKYAAAIDLLVDSFDKLRSAAEKRYSRTDIDQREKDLKYFDGTNLTIMNNEVSETTSADPNKISRNATPVAIANLRAQSKAIKNGWTVTEARLMGVLGSAVADAENTIKNENINLKNTKGKIKQVERDIEEALKAGKDATSLKNDAENYKNDIKKYETNLTNAKNALKDSKELYEKYENIKNPDFAMRRDALKDTKALLDKYKGKSIINIAEYSFNATEDKLTDPYDFKEKTRLEQAEDMLKSLKDVDSWGRSSNNFKELKASVEKLVEMARKYPQDLNEKQFRNYEKQTREVQKKIDKYLNGKEKENKDYKASHKGKAIKRSEYTAKRINTVSSLRDKINSHISMGSEKFTKEYTGTPEERAMAKYESIIKRQEEYRYKILGTGSLGINHEGESLDMSKEANSFCRSLYVEKMRERYEYDPNFSAYDFMDSLNSEKINKGAKEEFKNLNERTAFKEHMKQSIRDRIDNVGEPDETYDDRIYVINDPIPDGVGQDWVRYELKNYRAMYNIPEPSRADYVDEDEPENEIEEKKVEEKKEEKKAEEKKEEKKVEEKKEEKKAEEKKEEKKSEPKKKGELQDNLAGKIYKAMGDDDLLKYSQDPLYKEIAKNMAEHSAKEEPGKNTKLPMSTMMKMARYVDKMYDIKKPSEDDVTRRNIVQSAFDQYNQKTAKFEKTSGDFMFKVPEFNPRFGYVHGQGYYKELFYKNLESSSKKIGEAYQAKPEDQKLAKDVLNKAYQVIMTDVVENTIARQKGTPYDTINRAYDSTADKKQRDAFIDDHLVPESFKKNYEKLILDGAKKGKMSAGFASDSCDKALAMTLDDAKKAKDTQTELKVKHLMDKLKRNPRQVEKLREKAPEVQKTVKK